MGGHHILCQILNSLGLNYGLEDLRFNSQNGHEISTYKKYPDCLWGPASLLFNGHQG